MRFHRVAMGAAVVLLAMAPAFGEEAAAPDKAAQAMKKADTNGDGKLTFEELAAVRPKLTKERFALMDRNGDGVLDKADREAATPQNPSKEAARTPRVILESLLKADANDDKVVSYDELTAARPEFPRERFDKLDRNKDGVISEADLPAATAMAPKSNDGQARGMGAKKLMQADADKDGKVTFDEALAAKPGLPRATFDRFDTNQDGVLSQADLAKVAAKSEGKGPAGGGRGELLQRLRNADTDGDGKVSREEAKTGLPNLTDEMFKRLDRNGDGMIGKDDRRTDAQL